MKARKNKINFAIPYWLEEFLNKRAEECDLNMSDTLRLHICSTILATFERDHPEFCNITLEEIFNHRLNIKNNKYDHHEKYRIINDIYYETRKAIEHYTKTLPKKPQ